MGGTGGQAYYLTPEYATVKERKPFNVNALRCVRQALAIDPSNVTGEVVRLLLLWRNKEFAKARAGLDRLTTLNGINASISHAEGFSRAAMGQTKAAIPYLEKAVILDPANSVVRHTFGIVLFNSGDLDGAKTTFQKGLDLGFSGASSYLANIAFMQGDSDAAIDIFLTGYDTFGQFYATQFQDRSLWEVAAKGYYSGKEADRLKLLAVIDAYMQSPDPIIDWVAIEVYLRAGEAKAFMDTFEAHTPANTIYALTNLWGEMETSRKVRQHPDFQGFAKRNGLLEYWQTYGWPDKCRPVEGNDPDAFECD
ncbi:MAG: tetratricopeptide repeat protein [Robiginitomaculum sp.]|nr:tetratricopeptide repeat protein [Robiginitomaculum sp.]